MPTYLTQLREDDVVDSYTFAENCRKREAKAAQDAAPSPPVKQPVAPPAKFAVTQGTPEEQEAAPEEAAYKDAHDHIELFLEFGELRERDEGEREEARRWIEFMRHGDSDLVLMPRAVLNILLEHIKRLQAPKRKDNKRRDLFIAWLVARLIKKHGLSPYRNRATQRPSACSTVADALSEHGMPLGPEAVEVIWRRFGPEPHA
jgi:hypothetical protein